MPREQDNAGLEARIDALEQRVAELEAHAAARPTTAGGELAAQRPAPAVRVTPNRPTSTPAPARSRWAGEHWVERGEGWLGRAGIGLVVVGLILLFRYAVDRGWLTPTLRIGVGLAIGGALLFAGLRHFQDRRSFRQILMGGGVVILFITGLAASELYQLVHPGVALAFHALVAAVAFGIARRQRDPVMASIGASGALLPPGFLLEGSVAGGVLWLYLLIMVLWTGLLIATSGWASFILVAAGAGVLATFHHVPAGSALAWLALLVLVAVWCCYAALPLLRPLLPIRAPAGVVPLPDAVRLALPLLVMLGVAVAASFFVFRTARAFETAAALAGFGFVLIGVPLRREHAPVSAAPRTRVQSLPELELDGFEIAVLAAAFAFGAAAIAAFELPLRMVACGALAAGAVALAPVLRVPLLAWIGHLLFGYVLLEFLAGIGRLSMSPPFDTFALGLAAAAGFAALAVSRLGEPETRAPYLGGIYIVALTLLATELSDVAGAPWLASAAYALVGGALVLLGLGSQRIPLQRAGMLTLALLVLRLFTFDLAAAGVGVRIVLFLVFGFGFLALSYRFRARRGT